MRSFEHIRRNYPFVTFGEYRERWDGELERCKWLLGRLDREQPTTSVCHEWYRVHNLFVPAVETFAIAVKNLPDSLEFHKGCAVGDTAPWPEDYGPLERCEDACIKAVRISKEVAAVLMEKERYIEKKPNSGLCVSPAKLREARK